MTLLSKIRRESGSPDFIAKIDQLRANPVPYTFEKGKIPAEALDQGMFWRDRSGKLYEIEEMHPLHAQRAVSKLWGAYQKDPDVIIEHTVLYKALVDRAVRRA